MRFRTISLLTIVGILAWLPMPATAAADADVEAQLQEMRERLGQMEDRLQATNDQLDASKQRLSEQQSLLERSGVTSAAGATSGLASFLESLEIGGWVNASYWYNFNDVDNDNLSPGPVNAGTFGTHNFYNPDSNTFSLDQLWLELERPVDEGNRAGFRADIVMGKLADIQSSTLAGSSTANGLSGDEEDFYVHQAYVQYLAPLAIGDGVKIVAGKFATLIGYEVIQAPYNYQISRGIVWQNLQPVDHVGVLASTNIDNIELALGVANGFNPIDRDNNDGKTLLGRIGLNEENYSIHLNAIWGPEVSGTDRDKLGVLDLVATWQVNEDLSLWANGDILWADPTPCSILAPPPAPPLTSLNCNILRSDGRDAYAWGAAVGGRLALTERTGVSLRGEYLADDGAYISNQYRTSPVIEGQDITLWSVTGTVDHKLTEQLMVRAELRWDKGRLDNDNDPSLPGFDDQLFAGSRDGSSFFTEDDQYLIGADVTYMFD